MHGLINRSIQLFMQTTYGDGAWAAVAEAAGAPAAGFESTLQYEDALTDRLIAAAAAHLGKPPDMVLEDLGTWLVSHPETRRIRRLLRFSGDSFAEFLSSLDDLPDRARLAVPDLDLPDLALARAEEGGGLLEVRSERPGWADLLVGMLRAMADDYGALAMVEARPPDGTVRAVQVRLLDTAFAAGRRFSLADDAGGGPVPRPSSPGPPGGRGARPATGAGGDAAALARAALDRLMPLHLALDGAGRIRHAGPTLLRLCPNGGLVGRPFAEMAELRRPREVQGLAPLLADGGGRVELALRFLPRLPLKGLAVPLADGGALVDLAFGFSLFEAVRRHDLTSADFSATDLVNEMLFLFEAKSATQQDLARANRRLEGARLAAEEQAFTDTLTGLKNRRAMDEVLARLTASGTPFGLMHLDLDYFKEVNDTHGHAAGDAVLEAVSQVLADETRAPDTVARVGGDEFVLVFQGLVASDRLEAIAGRILRRLEQPVAFDPGVELRISGSIGVTVSTFYRPPDPARMLHDADLALYASKRAGRGRMTFHRPAPVAAGEPPGDGRAPG